MILFKGIVVWAVSLNPHCMFVYNEIAKKIPVTLCVMRTKFRNLGNVNLDNCGVITINSVDDLPEETLNNTYLHFCSGMKKRRNFNEVISDCERIVIEHNCPTMALNLEQYPWWGVKGLLRSIQWCWIYNFGLGKNIKAFGCLGESGIKAYRRSLINKKRILDYVYAPPCVSATYIGEVDDNCYQIIFVGGIASRKAIIETALNLKKIKEDFHFSIIGEGNQVEELKRIIADDDRMTYLGKKEMNEVHEILERTDCLILSSTFDGWGATTNEALLHGCRCIVSDHAGSHSLINYNGFGQVYSSGNNEQFIEAVKKEIARGKVSKEERDNIKKWAKNIEPEAVAEYLIKVINYYFGDNKDKPMAPWRTDKRHEL